MSYTCLYLQNNQHMIDMDKFSLKWNDFQSNVAKTFSVLRKEEDFFDVTLVTDDEQHISAHKLVLAASSEFFKTILQRATHSKPMIYLSGFGVKELNFVMDYIYQGEVQIYQNDLDKFLDVAQKLKIEGLIGGEQSDESKNNTFMKDEDQVENVSEISVNESVVEKPTSMIRDMNKYQKRNNVNTAALVSNQSSVADAKAAVNELVEKTEDSWMCRTCGKTAKTSSDIRRHAEIHIDGLAFDCELCGQTFRSRKIVNNHKFSKHRN